MIPQRIIYPVLCTYNRRLVVKLKNVKPEYLNVKKEDNP